MIENNPNALSCLVWNSSFIPWTIFLLSCAIWWPLNAYAYKRISTLRQPGFIIRALIAPFVFIVALFPAFGPLIIFTLLVHLFPWGDVIFCSGSGMSSNDYLLLCLSGFGLFIISPITLIITFRNSAAWNPKQLSSD